MNIYLFQTREEAAIYAHRLTRKNKGWWYNDYWCNLDKTTCDKFNAKEMHFWKQKTWEGEIGAIEIFDQYNNQVCIYGYWE